MAEGGDGRREGGKERGEEQERGKMWETGRCGQGEVEREGDGVRLYFVPFTLTFGHYDLAGIPLTTLVYIYSSLLPTSVYVCALEMISLDNGQHYFIYLYWNCDYLAGNNENYNGLALCIFVIVIACCQCL